MIDIGTQCRKEFTRYFALFPALASVRWSVAARIESRLLRKSRLPWRQSFNNSELGWMLVFAMLHSSVNLLTKFVFPVICISLDRGFHSFSR